MNGEEPKRWIVVRTHEYIERLAELITNHPRIWEVVDGIEADLEDAGPGATNCWPLDHGREGWIYMSSIEFSGAPTAVVTFDLNNREVRLLDVETVDDLLSRRQPD